jgi:hypothetical protein
MADNKIPYARRHPYKAILWFVVLAGSVVGLIAAFSGRYFEILAVVVVLIALIGLIRLGYHREWTGFGTAEISKPGDKEIRPRKTLWDWLGLLIVPGVLALGALWFERAQDNRQRVIEDRRAQAAQQVEEQRAQDEALQAYLDQMSSLLLEKDLRVSEEESEVRTLAQARTLTVLERLEPSRKTAVMQFLIEAELVQSVEGGRGPIITLAGVNLSGADLSGADLSDAALVDAALVDASLLQANMSKAALSGADLFLANLREANLSRVYALRGSGTDLREADLRNATLHNAWVPQTNMSDADLSDADLSEANLQGATLRGADLSGAEGWTEDQLSEAGSLEEATMPNGQKYEDWLKSKRSGEDEKSE